MRRPAKNDTPEQWLALINDMLDSQQYEWAEDTLFGVGEWIEEHDLITENQKTAIENIYNARAG